MMKITFLLVCLIAICIEFKETSACGGGGGVKCPEGEVVRCFADTNRCKCVPANRRSAMISNMKERYLMEELFTPENLYKIAGAIHKEIHETIDGINKKFYTSG